MGDHHTAAEESSFSSSAFPALSPGFTVLGEISAYVMLVWFFFLSNLRGSHIHVFMDGACWVCFYCWHSPV